MQRCKYCGDQYRNNGIAIHEGRCKKNPKNMQKAINPDSVKVIQGSGQESDSKGNQQPPQTPPVLLPEPTQDKCVETPILHRTPPEIKSQQGPPPPGPIPSFSEQGAPVAIPDSPYAHKIYLMRLKEQKEEIRLKELEQKRAAKAKAKEERKQQPSNYQIIRDKMRAKKEAKALAKGKADSTIVETTTEEVDDEAQDEKMRPPMRNPESLLNALLSIPIWLLIIAIVLNINVIEALMENPYMDLIIYVVTHPSETASAILLTLMIMTIAVIVLFLHRVLWRMAFKDLVLKDFKIVGLARPSNEGDEKEITSKAVRTFMPSTKIGRIYLSIGAGFWDKRYRKMFHVPYPDTITLYVKRSWKPINPFKPLASCDIVKIYNPERLEDPNATRLQKDGRWRTIAQGNRLLSDFTDNSLEYWVDSGFYYQPDFNSNWYEQIHSGVLDKGLRLVTKGCQINSDIQQDQLRNNVLHIPVQEIDAEKDFKQMKEYKEAKGV